MDVTRDLIFSVPNLYYICDKPDQLLGNYYLVLKIFNTGNREILFYIFGYFIDNEKTKYKTHSAKNLLML